MRASSSGEKRGSGCTRRDLGGCLARADRCDRAPRSASCRWSHPQQDAGHPARRIPRFGPTAVHADHADHRIGRPDVPETNRAVPACRRKEGAITAQRHAGHFLVVATDEPGWRAIAKVPEPHQVIFASGCQVVAGVERERPDLARVPREALRRIAAVPQTPQRDGALRLGTLGRVTGIPSLTTATRRQVMAIGTRRHRAHARTGDPVVLGHGARISQCPEPNGRRSLPAIRSPDECLRGNGRIGLAAPGDKQWLRARIDVCDGEHPASRAGERISIRAGVRANIPEMDRSIPAGGRQHGAITVERGGARS